MSKSLKAFKYHLPVTLQLFEEHLLLKWAYLSKAYNKVKTSTMQSVIFCNGAGLNLSFTV